MSEVFAWGKKRLKMMIKIMRFLIKVEMWFLNKCIEKDTVEYEDYFYTIKNHEKEIERINSESKID